MFQDERYVHCGIEFTWNAGKAATNLETHSIAFHRAVEAFFDPFLQIEDATKGTSEVRQAVLGLTKDWHLLFVVFKETENGIRVISARSATAGERKRYEDG